MNIKQKTACFPKRENNEFKPELTSSSPYGLAAQVYSLRGCDLSVVSEI
jgi:hypothetical protein